MVGSWRLSIVLGAGLGALVAAGVHALHIVGDEPRIARRANSCTACHTMQRARETWAAGGHRAATDCLDCHLPAAQPRRIAAQIRSGISHILHEAFDAVGTPVRIRVASRGIVDANCTRCHEQRDAPDAVRHDGVPRAGCTHCHPREGHR
jgi:cytochrome c nitrite reductase small subunit